MSKLDVNIVIKAPYSEVSAQLSFIATDNARRLFGICPKFVAEEIRIAGAFIHAENSWKVGELTLKAREPVNDASSLLGYFGLALGQPIDPNVPQRTASPFDALGRQLFVYGSVNRTSMVLDRVDVSVPTSSNGEYAHGLLELRSQDGSIPTNGTLIIDDERRGVCILVGRVGRMYLAVGLRDCLSALELKPIVDPDEITYSGEEINLVSGDGIAVVGDPKSGERPPSGQLFDILCELEPDAACG